MHITINKQRMNLCDAPHHPPPLIQVSVLLQNLQQLPQVPNLTRIVMMMKTMHKTYHLTIGPQDQKKGRPKTNVTQLKLQKWFRAFNFMNTCPTRVDLCPPG